MERHGMRPRRRHAPLAPGARYGFLQPPRRGADDEEFQSRLRADPALRRQYRNMLLVQMTVVGALLLACATLVVQAIVMVRRVAVVTSMGWVLPVGVGLLALLVLRRFLRLLHDYRELGSN
jgi:hypothetical protein